MKIITEIFNGLKSWFETLNMQKKIFSAFMFIIFIPSLLVLISLYSIYSKYVENKTVFYHQQLMGEVNKNIDINFNNYKRLTMQLYYNREFMQSIQNYNLPDSVQERTISGILQSMVNSDKFISSAYLITEYKDYIEGTQYQGTGKILQRYNDNIIKADGAVVWIPSSKMKSNFGYEYCVFAAARAIRQNNKQLGLLVLFLREDFFKNIFKNIEFESGVDNFIISQEKVIVSSSKIEEVGKTMNEPYVAQILLEKDGVMERNIDGEDKFIVFSTSNVSGWTFVSTISKKQILGEIYQIKSAITFVIFLYLLFLLLLSYVFSKSLTKPIQKLGRAMDKAAQGNLNVCVVNEYKDEIGRLSDQFNDMINNIKNLMNKVKEEQQLKNEAKLKALRMQMNPHFLYNTLNTIRWTAVINKQENIKVMTDSLIKLLRNVSKEGPEFITLQEELELVKCYVNIQKMRFLNFNIKFDVQQELMDLKIDKFILQPIVENCIVHGFNNFEGIGQIEIRAELKYNKFLIYVEDNGRGFDTEQEMDKKGSEEMEHNHLGIKSINERIVLKHGQQYGIEIYSKIGCGTTVILKLPVIR